MFIMKPIRQIKPKKAWGKPRLLVLVKDVFKDTQILFNCKTTSSIRGGQLVGPTVWFGSCQEGYCIGGQCGYCKMCSTSSNS